MVAATAAEKRKTRIIINNNARGRLQGAFEIMLPYDGITRIRFNGYDLNRTGLASGTPAYFRREYSYFF